jgi:5-methylcytosine-specific restriction endonuclease McrA
MDNSLCPFSQGAKLDKCCYNCTKPLTGRRTRWCSPECCKQFYLEHHWSAARKAAKRRAKYMCETCGSNEKLEVNHIIPLVGTKRTWSCLNHRDNLEVLCHKCHVVVTNQQRKDRKK